MSKHKNKKLATDQNNYADRNTDRAQIKIYIINLIYWRDTMGRDFVVTNENSASLGVKKRTVGRRISIGPKASRFVAIVIFAALGILYLTQSTQGADRSYKIRDLTSEKSELSEQRDRLQIEASRLESLNEIDKALNQQANQDPATQMQPSAAVTALPTQN